MPDHRLFPDGEPAPDPDGTEPTLPITEKLPAAQQGKFVAPPPIPARPTAKQPAAKPKPAESRQPSAPAPANIPLPAQPVAARLPPRVVRERGRRDSGFYLPLWSVLLMLLGVVVVTGMIVLGIFALGANRPTPDSSQPQVVIVSAVPSNPAPQNQPTQALPTVGPLAAGPSPAFNLEGPILPTAFLSPTPDTIAIGKLVTVINVGESGLNVRQGAGTSFNILFHAAEGDVFRVVEGPTNADNLTWWRIERISGTQYGWAAQNNGEQDLLMVAAPTNTP